MNGEAGMFQVSLEQFDYTECPRTTGHVLSEFGAVRLHRTSSNHCDEWEACYRFNTEYVREGEGESFALILQKNGM